MAKEKTLKQVCARCPYKEKVWLFMGDDAPTPMCNFGRKYHDDPQHYCNPCEECRARQKDKRPQLEDRPFNGWDWYGDHKHF